MSTRDQAITTMDAYAAGQREAGFIDGQASRDGEVADLGRTLASVAAERDAAQTAAERAARELAEHMATHRPPMIVGAAHGGNSDPGPLESFLGFTLGGRRTYFGGTTKELDKAVRIVDADHAAGREPFLSFKLPHSWADMTRGLGDAWVEQVRDRITAATPAGRRTTVYLHHEPEGDGGPGMEHIWVAVQNRCLPRLRSDRLRAGICLTGWHSLQPNAVANKLTYGHLWSPEAAVLSVDLYQLNGSQDGKVKGWTPLGDYFARTADFAANVGVPWGLGETAVGSTAYALRPESVEELFAAALDTRAEHLLWFDSSLNSSTDWTIVAAPRSDLGDTPARRAKAAAFLVEASKLVP